MTKDKLTESKLVKVTFILFVDYREGSSPLIVNLNIAPVFDFYDF